MKKVKDYTNRELLEEAEKRVGCELDDFTEALREEIKTRRRQGNSFDLEAFEFFYGDKTKPEAVIEENEKNTGGINIKYNTHTGEAEFNIDPKDLAVIFSTLKELQDLMKKP